MKRVIIVAEIEETPHHIYPRELQRVLEAEVLDNAATVVLAKVYDPRDAPPEIP